MRYGDELNLILARARTTLQQVPELQSRLARINAISRNHDRRPHLGIANRKSIEDLRE